MVSWDDNNDTNKIQEMLSEVSSRRSLIGREVKAMYVYIQTEISPPLWTVGFYSPDGKWHSDSDHDTRESAAERVHYLNGG